MKGRCLRRGLLGLKGRPTGKARIRLRPTWGWSRKPHPRGAGGVLGIGKSSIGSWRRKRRSSHSRAWRGEGSTGRRRGWVLGSRLWSSWTLGTVPGWARARGLDQARTRTALLRPPPPFPRAAHLCPRCSSSNSGAGGIKHRSSCPLCRAAPSSPPPSGSLPPL